ncbi:MAG: hypothetical protein JST17_09900 [Bacteroidetes bacterium]|nr:hypothetical protein [Bacteroidota bacterium]
MKKILFAILIALLSGVLIPAHAGTLLKKSHKKTSSVTHIKKIKDTNWVNYQTEQHFFADFPKATNVKWGHKNFDEATFRNGRINETAYYDFNNNLIGTSRKVSFSRLPEKAQIEIQKEYPGYDVSNVILFKDNTSNDTEMMLYNTTFEDADNYFAELIKGTNKIALKISMDGNVSFFQNIYK